MEKTAWEADVLPSNYTRNRPNIHGFYKSHWVMVVMDQFSRRIIGFAAHGGALDGPTVCRMFNRIVSGSRAPRYVSSDNDPLFLFHQWQANLRILDVTEVKTVPYVPLSHPFIERLIGTVRRKYLDQVPFWSARDLDTNRPILATPNVRQAPRN